MIGIKIDSNAVNSDYHIWFCDTKQSGTGFYGFYYVSINGNIMEWSRGSHKELVWYINVDDSKRIRKFLKYIQ